MTVDERPLVRDIPHDLAAIGLEELIEASEALRHQLVTQEASCRRVLADVRDGVAVGCSLPAVRADVVRSALTESMKAFEAARHRARLLLVAMSLDEGSSISAIARTWGVSRQLASRWVQETEPLRPTGPGPEPGDRS